MIPDEVRQALDYVIKRYYYSELCDDKGDTAVDTIREWQRSLPQVPQPDWSSAPEWAQWWAVDADGSAMWYAAEPFIPGVNRWTWDVELHTEYAGDTIIDIPIGIDWRTLKVRRPEVTE